MSWQLDELIESRAHRILGHLSQYRKIDDLASGTFYELKECSFSENEKPIGVYQNAPGANTDLIVITTRGLHVFLSNSREVIS
jgi:hypothetical protein